MRARGNKNFLKKSKVTTTTPTETLLVDTLKSTKRKFDDKLDVENVLVKKPREEKVKDSVTHETHTPKKTLEEEKSIIEKPLILLEKKITPSSECLDSTFLFHLLDSKKSESPQIRFKLAFYDCSLQRSPTSYIQFVNWRAINGSICPITIELNQANDFGTREAASDVPFSWLFTSNTGVSRMRPEGFRQVYPHYVEPTLKIDEPRYYTFTLREKNETEKLGYFFSSRDGNACEIVTVKKGKYLKGEDVYGIGKSYLRGFFPRAEPILADFAKIDDLTSHQRAHLDKYNLDILLKLISVLDSGKTYYEKIDKEIKLFQGVNIKTAYDGEITQDVTQRNNAINKLQSFTLGTWHKLLPQSKKNKTDLKSNLFTLYQKVFNVENKIPDDEFNKTTLQTFVRRVKAIPRPASGGVSNELIDLVTLLGTSLNFREANNQLFGKTSFDVFRKNILELVRNSTIWIVKNEAKSENSAATLHPASR